jgi:deazaflavin-dependent oxidoreductase (nitroreductase family)
MDPSISAALDRNHTIDLTTTGRRSGQARRIEIMFHSIDGRVVISGAPSSHTRAWLHNVRADPAVTLHFKGPDVVADVQGVAHEVTDPDDRRQLMEQVARNWRRDDVHVMMRLSPLIEVEVPGYSRTGNATVT